MKREHDAATLLPLGLGRPTFIRFVGPAFSFRKWPRVPRGMLPRDHRRAGRRRPQGPGAHRARASLGLPQRHREGRRGDAGSGRTRRRASAASRSASRSGRPARRSGCACSSSARSWRPASCAIGSSARCAGATRWPRGRGVPRGPRRGRRPPVARRRSLRRLPRDPDAVAGHRAGQARDRGGARGAAEATGHRRAQRPARADARGAGADRLGAARRGAGASSR